MIASYPNRNFQLWEYQVSHGSLLVRSPRTSLDVNNVDFIFSGVEFIALPRHMKGLLLEHGNDSERATATVILGKEISAKHVFVISSGGKRHIVVGAACQVSENSGDMFDSPFCD